jgi:hypothetical protein
MAKPPKKERQLTSGIWRAFVWRRRDPDLAYAAPIDHEYLDGRGAPKCERKECSSTYTTYSPEYPSIILARKLYRTMVHVYVLE